MKKPIQIGHLFFKTQSECEKYTRKLLTEVGVTDSVKIKSEDTFHFLLLLCKRHPDYIKKLQHFSDFNIQYDTLNTKALALNIVNKDGSYTTISWKTCVTGKNTSNKTMFNSALRVNIESQIFYFKKNTDLSFCKLCNCSLNLGCHIDHEEPQFQQLVDNFIHKNKIDIPTDYNKKEFTSQPLFKIKDKWIGTAFETYHLEHAKLRVLCPTCNLTRKKL